MRRHLAHLLAAVLGRPRPPACWAALPLRPASRSGRPGVPINLALVGSRGAVLAAFRRIGWVAADPLTARTALRLAVAALLRRPYPAAPVSRLDLVGRRYDLAVEYELGATIARRDHARLWCAERVEGGRPLWLVAVARDQGVEIRWRHHLPTGLTHHIAPALDAARGRLPPAARRGGR